jgi:GABA(A) receptor-associated protein
MSIQTNKKSKEQISESLRIINKFPNRIPVIVESNDFSLNKILNKNKFLVPYDTTVSYFLVIIRKQMNLDSSTALFLFCDNILISGGEYIHKIYNNYKQKNNIKKNDNQFLYIQISKENTFG